MITVIWHSCMTCRVVSIRLVLEGCSSVMTPLTGKNFVTTHAETQYSAFGMHSTSQEVSLTVELYTVQYGTTTGKSGTEKVGSVVTGVTNSNAEINVSVENFEVDIDQMAPEYIFHPPLIMGDPLAQSFTVANPSGDSGRRI